jgi:hypothetical protein
MQESRPTRTTERRTIGVVEAVLVRGRRGSLPVRAKVDTGASRTSLDTRLARRLGLGPVVGHVRTRSAAADVPDERDVVRASIVIAGRTFRVQLAITDRRDMRYRMIIGMDVLRRGRFLVDPRKRAPLRRRRLTPGSKPSGPPSAPRDLSTAQPSVRLGSDD